MGIAPQVGRRHYAPGLWGRFEKRSACAFGGRGRQEREGSDDIQPNAFWLYQDMLDLLPRFFRHLLLALLLKRPRK